MLNSIIILRKKFGISINKCKNFLQKNNYNLNNTINFIKKIKILKKDNLENFSIISFLKKNTIYVLKIKYNSKIINNSSIINNLITEFNNIKINVKNILNILSILSIKLNEFIFLEYYFNFVNKEIEYYNHNNLFFCLIKFKQIVEKTICFHIISCKTNFIKIFNCKFSIINQSNIKNNKKYDIFIIKNILFFFLIKKNKVKFVYE